MELNSRKNSVFPLKKGVLKVKIVLKNVAEKAAIQSTINNFDLDLSDKVKDKGCLLFAA